MNNLVLVYYIGVAGIRSEDIDDYIHKVMEKIVITTIKSEIIVIPVQSENTQIECINPKYITNKALIIEHNAKMKKLQEELQYQVEQIKTKNDK